MESPEVGKFLVLVILLALIVLTIWSPGDGDEQGFP